MNKAYLDFLAFAGKDAKDCAEIEAKTASLFAPDFKKSVNGHIVLEGRDKLGAYLWNFREKLGRWETIRDLYPTLSSQDSVAITFTVASVDLAEPMQMIVIAILKIDQGKITEIYEVDHDYFSK